LRQALAGLGDLGRVLDVPAGAGRFLPLLGERAREVVASDVSVEMLQLARSPREAGARVPADACEPHSSAGGPPRAQGGHPVSLVGADLLALPFRDGSFDAVVSIACGVGVQTLVRHFPKTPVFPGVNTTFLGETVMHGVWEERCQACGNCILEKTGGICPISRCAKQLFNGPCGGSSKGKCEIKRETDCAWQLIYDRLKTLGQLYKLEEIIPARRWGVESRDSGPRRIVREDLKV
jgi:SAM-dependent methyltransferase